MMMSYNTAFFSQSAQCDAEWRSGGGTSIWYCCIILGSSAAGGVGSVPLGSTSRSRLREDGAADVADVVFGVSVAATDVAVEGSGVGTRIDGS